MEKVISPLVSIITPSFNQGEYLESTIRSVLDQDYNNIEYIVIDGGSRDKSVSIIRKYEERITYWVSEQDNGQAEAINKGLAISTGDIIGWLNSDDLILPSAVTKVVEAFNQNPDVDVVYGRLQRIDQSNRVVPTPILPKDLIDFDLGHIIDECLVNQPGSFWKRQIMDKIGYLDHDLKYAIDYDYWIRIALAGGRFLHLPLILAQFRLNPDSKTAAHTGDMSKEQLTVLEKYLTLPDLKKILDLTDKQLNHQARKARSIIQLHIFYGYLKKRKLGPSICWLYRAIRNNPIVLLNRRWLRLAIASVARHSNINRLRIIDV
jgi:glycosyltransferase involved in cell wall biosynthesis